MKEVNEIPDIIRPIMVKLTHNLIKERPTNIELHMIQWLQNYGNYTSTGLTKDEKKELEDLRNEVKRYRQMDAHRNQAIKEDNDEDEDRENDSFSEDNDDDIDPSLDVIDNLKKKMSVGQRSGVSAEAYGDYNQKENYKPRQIQKTDEQIQRIKTRILHSFLFGNLEPKDLDIVIGAMEEKKFTAGQNLITQGQNGDCLYVLEEGKANCFKSFSQGAEPRFIREYNPGDSFGELALLYNAPRAATVTATTDVVTWLLDRETFNHIVKDAAQKKRERYIRVLKQVDILSTIETYELMQISDALKTACYTKGDYLIKEGEMGDIFYILEEGECAATKTIEPGKPQTEIFHYKQGDYFGERALIKGEPRYANIVATSDRVRVISLDRDSFKRLLGPIEDLLMRNMEKYQTFMSPEA